MLILMVITGRMRVIWCWKMATYKNELSIKAVMYWGMVGYIRVALVNDDGEYFMIPVSGGEGSMVHLLEGDKN